MNDTKTTAATHYANAQIYWDDNTNDGWAYRYYCDGEEHSGFVYSLDPDADDAELVTAASEIPRECGTVTIYRGTSSVRAALPTA